MTVHPLKNTALGQRFCVVISCEYRKGAACTQGKCIYPDPQAEIVRRKGVK